MSHQTYKYQLYRHQKWLQDYTSLKNQIIENPCITPLEADAYRIKIRRLKEKTTKKRQVEKLNLLELKVCSREKLRKTREMITE